MRGIWGGFYKLNCLIVYSFLNFQTLLSFSATTYNIPSDTIETTRVDLFNILSAVNVALAIIYFLQKNE